MAFNPSKINHDKTSSSRIVFIIYLLNRFFLPLLLESIHQFVIITLKDCKKKHFVFLIYLTNSKILRCARASGFWNSRNAVKIIQFAFSKKKKNRIFSGWSDPQSKSLYATYLKNTSVMFPFQCADRQIFSPLSTHARNHAKLYIFWPIVRRHHFEFMCCVA